jgi:hypothetical protein
MQAMAQPLVPGCWDLALELLSAARSRRKQCTSLRHRRSITLHLHRSTSRRPSTSRRHPSTSDPGITGVRIEAIDASGLQPLVAISMRNRSVLAPPEAHALRRSLALIVVWGIGTSLTACSSESMDMSTASLGERGTRQTASDACNSGIEKRRWGSVSAMLNYKPTEPDHGYRRCVESKLNKADQS